MKEVLEIKLFLNEVQMDTFLFRVKKIIKINLTILIRKTLFYSNQNT